MVKSSSLRTFRLVPSSAARCAPAEAPQAAIRSTSKMIILRIGPEKTHSGLAIIDLFGERRLVAETVIHADHGEIPLQSLQKWRFIMSPLSPNIHAPP